MHSIKSYLERQTTEELQGLLRAYCEGYGDFDAETALLLCSALADRDPKYLDPRKEFLRLCRMYLT